MASRLELLQEAQRRGILPPDMQPLVDEAMKRGLIQPAGPTQSTVSDQPIVEDVGIAEGVGQSVLQGATLGFGDELQALIAASVASPFVQDRTFDELRQEALSSLRQERAGFKEENPALSTTTEIAGGLATGIPGIARLGAIRGGAAAGGLAGAGFADEEDFLSLGTLGDAAAGAGLGAAGGAILPRLISPISKAINRTIGRRLQVFDDAGQFTDDAIEELAKLQNKGQVNETVRNQLIKDGVLTPEQARRFNLFQRREVQPTRFNVTQETRDALAQQSAAKTNQAVSEVIAGQDRRLTELAQEGIESIAPRAQNLEQANAFVFNAIDDVVSRADDSVIAAYQAARQQAQGQPRVVASNLVRAISDNRGAERASGGVISTMRGVLRNKGLIRARGSFDVNKRAQRVSDLRRLTVNEAEEIRQELNSLFTSATPKGKELIRTFKDALDDDVARAVGDDIFEGARASRRELARLIERGARNKFDKTKGSFLEDVINNKIPEEKIIPKLLSGRDDDFLKIRSFLLEDAGPQGVAAFNEIKAQVIRNALNKAISTQGKSEGGQAVFNNRLFENTLRPLRDSSGSLKFRALFNADEGQLIDDIIEIGRLRVPQSNVQQGQGPSEVAIRDLKREIIQRIPLVGRGAKALSNTIESVGGAKEAVRVLDPLGETAKRLGD